MSTDLSTRTPMDYTRNGTAACAQPVQDSLNESAACGIPLTAPDAFPGFHGSRGVPGQGSASIKVLRGNQEEQSSADPTGIAAAREFQACKILRGDQFGYLNKNQRCMAS